ncbi:MAG: hypothetical protein N4A45_10850 [Flavobacteriales bacterium]|jgi:hypothetical protein|nr:hypothetical protein [Flavobacteriales bacterium]
MKLFIVLSMISINLYGQSFLEEKDCSAKEMYYIPQDKRVNSSDSAVFILSRKTNRAIVKGLLFRNGKYKKYTYVAGKAKISLFWRKQTDSMSFSKVANFDYRSLNYLDTVEHINSSATFDNRIIFVDFFKEKFYSAQCRLPITKHKDKNESREFAEFVRMFSYLNKLHPSPVFTIRKPPTLPYYWKYIESEIEGVNYHVPN